jgi:hypothetical protein
MVNSTLLGLLEGKGLLKNYVGREYWASTLGCDRTTIWRYESQIIKPVISEEYQASRFLDEYQQYILAVCLAQSRGWVDGKKRQYTEIQEWLTENFVSREQFFQHKKSCSAQEVCDRSEDLQKKG